MKRHYRPASEVRIVRHVVEGRFPTRRRRKLYKRVVRGPTFFTIVLDHLTDFIWLTPVEVLAIVEQVDDRLDEHMIRSILWHLVRRGKLEKRTSWIYGRVNGYQVKKPSLR